MSNYRNNSICKLITFILIPILILFYTIAYFSEPAFATSNVVSDIDVIPDKYNTGCSGTLETIKDESWIDQTSGCKFIYADGYLPSTKMYKINAQAESSNTIIIKDKFFDVYNVKILNDSKLTHDTHKSYKFINCKFHSFGTSRASKELDVTFDHCTVGSFYGSNSTFLNCYFGNTISDGMVPFQNVTVKNCFFSDFSKDAKFDSTTLTHTDGVQTYAYKDAPVKNVTFYNSRFEMPSFIYSNTKAYVNACLMLSNEYENMTDVTFEKCYLNGGGYSIYICSKDNWSIYNLTLKNIKVGCSHWYGTLYTRSSLRLAAFPTHNIQYDVSDTSELYVGSVWKDENNNVHISVTNDTASPKTLKVELADGTFKEFNIKASLPGSTWWQHGRVVATTDKYYYTDMPIDIDLTVPNTNWVKCYDGDTLIRTQVLSTDTENNNDSTAKNNTVNNDIINNTINNSTINNASNENTITNNVITNTTDGNLVESTNAISNKTIIDNNSISNTTIADTNTTSNTTIAGTNTISNKTIADTNTISNATVEDTNTISNKTTANTNIIAPDSKTNVITDKSSNIVNDISKDILPSTPSNLVTNEIKNSINSTNTISKVSKSTTTNTVHNSTSSTSLNKVDRTTASKTIPQTGIRDIFPFVIAWLIILQIFLFIKIKKIS